MEHEPEFFVEGVESLIREYLNNNNDNINYERGQNTIYFDGWHGIGASAVLAALSNLPRSKEFNFDRVLHMDFSKSQSRRSLQKKIAEQLQLDKSVMSLFDKLDEDDDFNGLGKGSRREIRDVTDKIYERLKEERVLVIFHNGSTEPINFVDFGIPVFDWKDSKVIWTYRGWFEPYSASSKETKAHVFRAWPTGRLLLITEVKALVREEATELAHYINYPDITPDIIIDCWFYLSLLHYSHGDIVGNDLKAHAANYWICDGIIKGESTWEAGCRLCEAMPLQNLPSKENKIEWNSSEWFEQFSNLHKDRSTWISITSRDLGTQTIPMKATTCFLILDKSDMPSKLFNQARQLRVLTLYSCAFNFASPPFACCKNLRFLWIYRCTNSSEVTEGFVEKHEQMWTSLKGLWVLDVRHTDWTWILSPHMIELMTELRELNVKAVGLSTWSSCTPKKSFKWPHNLRKFRVIDASMYFKDLLQDSFMDLHNLELLDLSGNTVMQVLPNLSMATRLKVLIVDGCDGLAIVEPDVLPSSLESFSFDGFGPAVQWKHSLQIPGTKLRPDAHNTTLKLPKVSKISLKGLARLKNVYLRGLPNLAELNLSETAVQALNLEAMEVQQLERLFLLGCEKLQRLKCADTGIPRLKLLYVDTRGKAVRSLDDNCQVFQWDTTRLLAHIVVTDTRFLRGLIWYDVSDFLKQQFHVHLSSTVSHAHLKETNKQEEMSRTDELNYSQVLSYRGVCSNIFGQNHGEEYIYTVRHGVPLVPSQHHVEISEGGWNLEIPQEQENLDFLLMYAESLHVHDHSSITIAKASVCRAASLVQFSNLRWCLIERCPKMHTVFLLDDIIMYDECFKSLEIFEAAHLLEVQCIWSRRIRFWDTEPPIGFGRLRYIHLHSCPRLKFVLPWSFTTLESLEIIHITHCGQLRHIFPKGEEVKRRESATSMRFSSLKYVYLQELPMLQQISEMDMLAPALEMVTLRGCWSLRRLPAIHTGRPRGKQLTVVDCEKDWWDKLDWGGLDESRSLFTVRHSRYYKRTMLRGSALR